MSKILQPATTDRADGTPQVEVSENVSADNGGLSGTGASSRRGSRTVNACEQCQRRKTKVCTEITLLTSIDQYLVYRTTKSMRGMYEE